MKGYLSVFYRHACLLVLMVQSCVLSAQNIPAVSPGEILEQRKEVFSHIKELNEPPEDSLWYQGRIYEFEIQSRTGSPYFLNAVSMNGSLIFNGKTHEDHTLTYNLVLDELILWESGPMGNMIQLVLNKYYVERFSLKQNDRNYHFRLHSEMNPIHDQLKEGFYEVVYDDELSMFIKHRVELSYDALNTDYYSYKYKKQVYLLLDEKIHEIKKRGDYLKAFQVEKKSLRKYIRQEKINFDNSESQALLELCIYSKSFLDQQDKE